MYFLQEVVDAAKDDLILVMKGQQLAQYVRQLYMSGARVYTKDMLFDLEYALISTEAGRQIRIRCMNGAYKIEEVPVCSNYDQPANKVLVTMLSIDEMISRAETAFTTGLLKDDGQCTTEDQKTIITCPVKITRGVPDAAPYALDRLESAWHLSWLNWGQSPVHEALLRSIYALDRQIPEVSKVLCLGLGPLGGFKNDRSFHEKAEDGQPKYRNIMQHMFASTLARALSHNYQENPLPLLVSDPEYTEHDKEILSRNGMRVVDGVGALALSKIDRNTLIISFNPSFPIKQVISDVTIPAAIIWDQFLSKSLASEGNYESCSPHVRRLCEEYDEHIICEEPIRFGKITMYTRKAMIENLAKAMETDIKPPKLNGDTELIPDGVDAGDMSEMVILDHESEDEWVVLK